LSFRKIFRLFIGLQLYIYAQKPLVLYCGITMVPAMEHIAKKYEATFHQPVTILQGGSGELLKVLSVNKSGDLYLPGSPNYLNLNNGLDLFSFRQTVAYMPIALFTRSGNPDTIKSLSDLNRTDIHFAIGSPGIGSIGTATQKLLEQAGGKKFAQTVNLNALYFATDSHDLNCLFRNHKIDIGLNWRPALLSLMRQNEITIIPLRPHERLLSIVQIAIVRYSRQQKAAKSFIKLLVSPEGQKILKEYGFETVH
jgi:molybdate transport system substrate-binding protein